VGLIAVSAFAFWAGPIVAGALGFAGNALVGGLATGLIGLGGSLLVNALIMPKPGATNVPGSTQDQIYSVLAQGNAAKLGPATASSRCEPRDEHYVQGGSRREAKLRGHGIDRKWLTKSLADDATEQER
jgi:hypothetical protein